MPGLPGLPSNLVSWTRKTGTNPAAGSEVSDAVPAGKSWWLVSVSVPLVQGITQTPQPILVVDDGATVVFESLGCSAAQAASTTCQYTWAAGLPLSAQLGSGAGIHATGPLPYAMLLGPGWRIRTVTLGIGANTDIGPPSYFVAEIG